jgi:diguanylate cyclase (GGDEF)-like protein
LILEQARTVVRHAGAQEGLFLRALLLVASGLVLVLVPGYQLIDLWIDDTPAELLRVHGAWRIPPVLIAAAALFACRSPTGERLKRILIRLLAMGIMAMMFGLFSVDLLHEHGNPESMARGLVICTFAVSLMALRGGREVLVVFAIPFLASLAWLLARGVAHLPVADLLLDSFVALFIAMITSELFFRIRSYQYELQNELGELARTDALTGLHNRRELERRIADEMSRSRRHAEPLSVVIGDLDHFKRVNDEFGHAVGDDVLRAVGERMRRSLRAEDLAVRWGGEEFLLLLPSTDLERAEAAADKIREEIAGQPIDCGVREVPVTISFGVAQLRDDEAVSDLIRRADDAMYRAKSGGRNRVCT